MFWDDKISERKSLQDQLAQDFSALLDSLMLDYRTEIERQLPSLSKALESAKKFDAFGNEITPEGKDEEVWEYFVEKNLWENIFNKKYKSKQANYLNHLEDFLSNFIESPERHIELFGRGLLWRYYIKLDDSGNLTREYLKTDDPLIPLVLIAKTVYKLNNQ